MPCGPTMRPVQRRQTQAAQVALSPPLQRPLSDPFRPPPPPRRPPTMAHAAFHWDDPFLLEQQLSNDERMVRDAAAAYCQERLAPRVLEAFRHEKMDTGIFREMGAMGLLGPTIPEQYGGPGLGYVAYGLIAREVE